MDLDARLKEFQAGVWNHSEDEFQIAFDTRPPLPTKELELLEQVVESFRTSDDDEISKLLRKQIRAAGETHFFLLLQIAGLTRNKILTDLRAASSSNRVRMPSSHWAIVSNDAAWAVAGAYLARKLRAIMQPLGNYDDPRHGLEAVNQATWPGFIRQERAKRQGHEAESRLAQVLASLGIPFEPTGKAENPMCADSTINGISFDLVIPSTLSPRIVVKSTVHTSNIGQYGESKDHLEVEEAQRMLASSYPSGQRPALLALIDGIGFRSNRAGLEGVLSKADEFCQFKTIWKAALMSGKATNTSLELALPRESEKLHQAFLRRFPPSELEIIEDEAEQVREGWVRAGEGFVRCTQDT